jgi:outer membrane protein assembly factor BamB/PKD repeat protein
MPKGAGPALLAAPLVLLLLLSAFGASTSVGASPSPRSGAHLTNGAPPRAVRSDSATGAGSLLEFPTAANWPFFGHDIGRSGNAVNETVLSVADASQIERVWASDANGSLGIVSGSLVVGGGYLYVGAWNGRLYELNAVTGQAIWNLSLAPKYHLVDWSDDSTFWNEGGIASTPEVVSQTEGNATYNTVYATAGAEYLYAINASTQSPGAAPVIEWKQNTTSYSQLSSSSSEWGYHYLWSSPLIYGGFAYVGLSALYDHIPIQAQVLQIPVNGTSHAPTHVFDVTGQSHNAGDVEGSIWSTPAADPATDTLWVTDGNNNGLYYSGIQPLTESVLALNMSNVTDLKGSYRVAEPADGNLDNDFGAGPTLFSAANGSALVGAINKDGSFYAYNRTNFSGGPCTNDSNMSGGHCLVPAWGGAVPSLAAATSGDYENSVSPAAVGGGRLYVAGGYTDYTPSLGGGSINALSPSTGKLLWRDVIPNESPLAGLTYANGLLVYAADASTSGSADTGDYGPAELVALNASSGAVLWSTQLNETVAGAPIVSDGRIYVGMGNVSTMSGANGTGWVDAFGVPLDVTANATRNGSAQYQFTSGVTGGMPPYSYTWTFGDGSSPSNLTDVVHNYQAPGSYNASLRVTDLAGAQATVRLAVAVVLPGAASFSLDPVDVGVPLWINYTPPAPSPSLTITWADLPPPCVSHDVLDLLCLADAPGNYSITVNWANGTGARGSTSLRVLTVDRDPQLVISAVPSPAAGASNVSVTTAVTGGTPPFQIELDFGDGSPTVIAAEANHTYGGPGTYPISASLTDAGGGTATADSEFTVATPHAPPPLSVEAWGNVTKSDSGGQYCVGNTGNLGLEPAWDNVSFSARASNGTPPYSFTWSFGDGSPDAVGSTVVHNYTGHGVWNVLLTATDSQGATNSTSLIIRLAPPPDPPRICPKPTNATFLGLPGTEGYALVAGVGIVAAAVVGVGVWRWERNRKSPPNPSPRRSP